MKNRLHLFIFSILFFCACKKDSTAPFVIPESVTSFNMIYDGSAYSSFTDLIKWNGAYYITFRSSDSHVGGKGGQILVIKSIDTRSWTVTNIFTQEGYDLRDPKFLLGPEKELLVNTEGFTVSEVPKKRINLVYTVFGDKAGSFIKTDVSNWPWRYTLFNNYYYAWGYTANPKDFQLIQTKNFIQYNTICKPGNLTGLPNEATIRFRNDSAYTVVRRTDSAMLGRAPLGNLCNLKWNTLPLLNFGGPNFIFYNNTQILMSGREAINGGYSGFTSLYLYDLNSRKILYKMRLPSAGDTSYPGLLLEGDELLMSYYSSHEGKPKIFFARIDLAQFLTSANAAP